MNNPPTRPRTGPMRFPGEIQPGVYLDHNTARAIFTGDGQRVLGEIRNALQGIQPVQQARLEEQVADAVKAVEEAVEEGLATGRQEPLRAALFALKYIQEFKRT